MAAVDGNHATFARRNRRAFMTVRACVRIGSLMVAIPQIANAVPIHPMYVRECLCVCVCVPIMLEERGVTCTNN